MDNIWYYEYVVKFWDQIDSEEIICSGIVPASSFTEAIERLETKWYGNDILEIQMLKPVYEGIVFEFQRAAEDKTLDFVINKKEKGD